MGRSLKKGPFADEHLLKKVEELNESIKMKVIKNSLRCYTFFTYIIRYMITIHVFIINIYHKQVIDYITEYMLEHKLGEFAPTHTYKVHSGVDKSTTTA